MLVAGPIRSAAGRAAEGPAAPRIRHHLAGHDERLRAPDLPDARDPVPAGFASSTSAALAADAMSRVRHH